MKFEDLEKLCDLLAEFRNESADREEFEKRDSVLFDVQFELKSIS